MSIPIIGVLPLWDEGMDSLWMLPGYMDGIKKAGGLPVMLPLTSDKSLIGKISEMVDGLLFTGGHDVFPELYGERTRTSCGPICMRRDEMETMLFKEAVLTLDKPALGICRGLQFINVTLGGTLYQDLPSQFTGKASINHQQPPPDNVPFHNVEIDKESPLYTLLNIETIGVNSTHHQGIRKLSEKLERMAVAEDGLVEAVFMPDKRFVWAVQWHPERTLHEEYSQMLFGALVSACAIG